MQQVSNAKPSTSFEIVVRDPVKHGDNSMSVGLPEPPAVTKPLGLS